MNADWFNYAQSAEEGCGERVLTHSAIRSDYVFTVLKGSGGVTVVRYFLDNKGKWRHQADRTDSIAGLAAMVCAAVIAGYDSADE